MKIKRDIFIQKEILLFSLPLFIISLLVMVVGYTDTLMLGYFRTPEEVGLYNAALPLASFIPMALGAIIFLYVPIATTLYSQRLLDDLKRIYSIITKWAYVISFPLFLILFLYSSDVLTYLFGKEYSGASTALKILALGFMFGVLVGPNWATLTALGNTKFLMFSSSIGAVANVALNYMLIPIYGIVGAAIASAFALITINLINSAKLFSLKRIHPFIGSYLRILAITSLFVPLLVFSKFSIILAAALLLVLSILIVKTNSIDDEDIMLIKAVKKRLGFL
jgi:O-antigen/teichoic acid export membrane protein